MRLTHVTQAGYRKGEKTLDCGNYACDMWHLKPLPQYGVANCHECIRINGEGRRRMTYEQLQEADPRAGAGLQGPVPHATGERLGEHG